MVVVYTLALFTLVFAGCRAQATNGPTPSPIELLLAHRDLSAVKTPEEFLRLAHFTTHPPSSRERQEMDRFVRESLEVFFHTLPTVDDVLTLLEQAVSDQRLSVDIRKMALEHTNDVEAYLELATPVYGRSDRAHQEALERFLSETKQDFIRRRPSVGDVKELERRSISSVEMKMEWVKAGLAVVNSLDTFLRLTELTDRHASAPYKQAMARFTRESLAELVKRGAVQLGELKLLEVGRADSAEAHKAFLEAGVPLVQTAEDFIQLARFTDDEPSSDYRQVRDGFLTAHRELFFSKRPTKGQLERVLLTVTNVPLKAEFAVSPSPAASRAPDPSSKP